MFVFKEGSFHTVAGVVLFVVLITFVARGDASITSVVANDPDNSDAVFSTGDVLVVTLSSTVLKQKAVTKIAEKRPTLLFRKNINNKNNINSNGKIENENENDRTHIIESDATGVGNDIVQVRSMRKYTHRRDVKTDANGGTPIYDDITKLNVINRNENQDSTNNLGRSSSFRAIADALPDLSTKTGVDAVFTFTPSLGADYTGVWASAESCTLAVVDASGSSVADLYDISNAARASNLVVGLAAGSGLPGAGDAAGSITVTGSFGTARGPRLTTAIFSGLLDVRNASTAAVELGFDMDTDEPDVSGHAEVASFLTFVVGKGEDADGGPFVAAGMGSFNGTWSAPKTLVVTFSASDADALSAAMASNLFPKITGSIRDKASKLMYASFDPSVASDTAGFKLSGSIKPSTSGSSGNAEKKDAELFMLLLVAVGGLALCVICGGGCTIILRRRKRSGGENDHSEGNVNDTDGNGINGPHQQGNGRKNGEPLPYKLPPGRDNNNNNNNKYDNNSSSKYDNGRRDGNDRKISNRDDRSDKNGRNDRNSSRKGARYGISEGDDNNNFDDNDNNSNSNRRRNSFDDSNYDDYGGRRNDYSYDDWEGGDDRWSDEY